MFWWPVQRFSARRILKAAADLKKAENISGLLAGGTKKTGCPKVHSGSALLSKRVLLLPMVILMTINSIVP